MFKATTIFIFLAATSIFAVAASADQVGRGSSAWQTWLSSGERIMPLAVASVRIADASGLDGLTAAIAADIRDLKTGSVARDKTGFYLASIWVRSINAAMMQRLDPFPNPAYQEIIDEGMNFAGDRLNIPDVDACMLLTAQTIIRAQKEAMAD